jgi:hypothetical protein
MLVDDRTPAAAGRRPEADGPRRRKGRPLEMSSDEVLRRIHDLGASGALFRVHREHPSLYARARRMFGSWAGAIARAGFDHSAAVAEARRRALSTRRTREAS